MSSWKEDVEKWLKDVDLKIIDSKERSLSIVKVPADIHSMLEEKIIKQPAGKALECLMDFCKAEFSNVQLKSNQIDTFKKQIQKQAKGKDIPEELFKKLSLTTTIDMIVLYPGKLETKFVAINAYVDDKGVAKQLEKNIRMTSICQACGLNNEVLGDAYIAMQFDNSEGFQRFDFKLSYLNEEIWIKQARDINLQARSPASREEFESTIKELQSNGSKQANQKSKVQQISVREHENIILEKDLFKKCLQFKVSGNNYFSKKEYVKAIYEYSKGLNLLRSGKKKAWIKS